MSSGRRIAAVARVETLQLLRSRVTFTLLLLVPALQVLLFGFAIRPTGAEITVAVAAFDPSLAVPVVTALQSQPGLRVDAQVLTPRRGRSAGARRAGDDRR
jgi:ABC-2 type transport system permease protein